MVYLVWLPLLHVAGLISVTPAPYRCIPCIFPTLLQPYNPKALSTDTSIGVHYQELYYLEFNFHFSAVVAVMNWWYCQDKIMMQLLHCLCFVCLFVFVELGICPISNISITCCRPAQWIGRRLEKLITRSQMEIMWCHPFFRLPSCSGFSATRNGPLQPGCNSSLL